MFDFENGRKSSQLLMTFACKLFLIYFCAQSFPKYKDYIAWGTGTEQRVDFIEDQAFSLSDALAPTPPLLSASCLSFSVFLCAAGRAF
jgi:hypothetical protein